ncbi:phosphotransferase [Rhodoluna sp.]|uniref:phosphotransferase n=1 Tax=Rhodoluna sp. TaxID=1969481 RepID=UPI0025E656EF|nr:phosphotransferase [Rhodoluna sp.]
MAKSPLILAALAKAAVPQYDFTQVKGLSAEGSAAFDTALLTSTTGEHYIIRIANTQAAGAEQEVELRALKAFGITDRMRLPFKITNLIGETKDDRGNRALVFEFIYGNPIDINSVGADSHFSNSIAKSIAAIHNLSKLVVEDAHLAAYEPADVVRNRIAELDRIAAAGKVPSILLSRWEAALEDSSLFRFQPTVIHGSLNGDSMLALDNEVTGVLGWSTLKISDPAEDFAWILATGIHELSDSVIDVYRQHHIAVDPGFRQRATLYSELELARWLMHGINKKDHEIIDDAVAMLEVLAEDVATGAVGRLTAAPISVINTFEPEVIEFEVEETEFEIIDLNADDAGVGTGAGYESDATRPIELPQKSENELF